MSAKERREPGESRKIHPLVQATYWTRVGGHPLLVLMVLSGMEDGFSAGLPMLAVALVWPQIAHLLGLRLRHRRAPFHVILLDGVITGAYLGFSGLAWTETGAWFLVMAGWYLMVGGLSFLPQGLLAGLVGLATTLPFDSIDLWAAPKPATVALSAAWLAFAFFFTSYLVNATTRRFVSIRHDLRARNEEISQKTQALSRALVDLANLAELTRIVNATLDVDEVIEKVIASLRDLFEFNQVAVSLVEEDGKWVRVHQHLGAGFGAEVIDQIRGARLPLDESESWIVRAITQNRLVYVPSIGREEISRLAPADRRLYELNPTRSLLNVPLEFEGSVIGAIYFGHTEREFDLSDEELTMIQRHVAQISTAIRNARLFQEAEKARAAALEASQAKSNFLANMTHELRTPMNAIIGYSEMLIEDAEEAGDPQTIDDLSKIRAAAQHLLALINDVLDLSKIEAGKMALSIETFDLEPLIESVISTIRPLADANRIRLEITLPEIPGTMEADETKVRQVLSNLLSNACKFTEGGLVSLKVERRGSPGAERIIFVVRDTGIGMTPDQVERIFQEFTQAESSTQQRFGGTGLGLSISRKFTLMMGGNITVTSEPGEGSSFILELPSRMKTPGIAAEATPSSGVSETQASKL